MRVRSLRCQAMGFLLVLLVGCDTFYLPDPPQSKSKEPKLPAIETGRDFEPVQSGTITGSVLWEGPVPKVAPYRNPVSPHATVQPQGKPFYWANPNVPVVDPQSKGVSGAVVFLRGVDAHKSRPWDLPPVRVVQDAYQFHIQQGTQTHRTGFVKRGDLVEITSAQPVMHSVRARGQAFFTLPFPHPSQPCARRLRQKGLVELTSGAGYYWMRGYLFVDDHPYYTHTDPRGKFTLSQVPAGTYDLVCWLPNWHEERRELDPDTARITRLSFRSPVERTYRIQVQPGELARNTFTLGTEDFGPAAQGGKW